MPAGVRPAAAVLATAGEFIFAIALVTGSRLREAAPAVYKAMLALQASVDKSGLEKDLMDLVSLRISYRNRTKVHRRNSLSGTVAFSHDQNCLALQISKRDHRCTHE